MRAAWQALGVMWTLHGEFSSGKKSARAGCLYLDRGSIDERVVSIDIYEPHIKSRGTIVVVHGMSPFGKDDQRIVSLCQALCHVGFRVVAPDIQSIRFLNIEPQQIGMVADVLDLITQCSELTPRGHLSVLAPSFSGAMCLAAAADERIRDKVLSVCAIGAFTDVDAVMNYLLSDDNADPYGRYIVLKKIIPMVSEKNVSQSSLALQRALDAAIQDNIHETTVLDLDGKVAPGSNIALGSCIQGLSDAQEQLVSQVLEDSRYREFLFACAKDALDDELQALDIASYLEGLSAKVFLLHGREDKVIPCAQSELLYCQLKSMEKAVGLVVSPFISHGDTHFSWRQMPDVWRLVKGFSFFFEDHHRLPG